MAHVHKDIYKYLSTLFLNLATYVVEDMLSNMCSHVSENVVLTVDQTWNLSISLQNSGSVSWDEVVDAKILLGWEEMV